MLARVLFPVLVLAQLGVGAAYAADSATAHCRADSSAAACRYAKGILWKIERGGHKPSYLLGTIHVDDSRLATLRPPVRAALDGARSFTMEMVLDDTALLQLAQAGFLADGRSLDAIVGAKRYAALEEAFSARGLPVASLKLMQPWFAAVTLITPSQANFLDLQLHAQALQQQKPVYGLESAQEQLSAFTGLGLDDQLLLLDDALRTYRDMPERVDELTRAYLARDLAAINELMKQQGLHDERLNQRLMKQLLDDRNVRMLERMRPRLEEGNAFIAVGAGHLAGDHGLLPLLERAGWRVTPVY